MTVSRFGTCSPRRAAIGVAMRRVLVPPALLALLCTRCVNDFVSAPDQPDAEDLRGRVVLQPAALALAGAGAVGQLHAQPVDFNGFALTGQRVAWQSLNPAVATVDSATGAVTAVASGQAIIRASASTLVGFAVVTVSASGMPSALGLGVTGTGTTEFLTAVWGASDTLAIAVGTGGTALRFDGAEWHALSTGTALHLSGVWGASARDVFVVGDSGMVQRFDGENWQRLSPGTTAALSDVWGASPRDVFVVGSGGVVLRFNGSRNRWTRMSIPTDRTLRGIWGTSASEVYAVGDEGTILHFDGRKWVAEPSGTGAVLTDVWGSGPDDVFAVGAGGTVLRRDPSSRTWLRQQSGTQSPLTGVWGTSRSEAYAVGAGGTVLRHEEGQWTAVPGGFTSDITAVWGTSTGSLHVVGAGGLSLTSGLASAPRLLFSSIPSTVTAGQAFRVVVRLVDAAGLPYAGADTVHVRLVDGPVGAALVGTTSVAASDAVATFDLALERAAVGYALSASATRLPAVRSPSIAVNPGPVSQVRFLTQPATAETDSLLRPVIQVALTDAYGNTHRGQGLSVAIALGLNANAGILSGTKTRRPASGVVAFDDLRVDRPGTDYTLVATVVSSGVAAQSDTFVVVGGGAPAAIEIMPSGASLPVGVPHQFSALVTDAQGNLKPNEVLIWAPAGLNPGVANANLFHVGGSTVSTDTGLTATVRGGRSGQGVLVATGSSGVTGYALVTTSNPAVPPVVAWHVHPSPTTATLYDIWRNEIVGSSGTWLRRVSQQASWEIRTVGTAENLRSVWGGAESGATYAVSEGGALLRVAQSSVTEVARAGSFSVRAVWGAAPREVFVAGAGGAGGNLVRYDGSGLVGVPAALGPADSIAAIYGFARDTLVLLFSDGRLRVGGREVACASVPVYDVWGPTTSDLFITGANGTILRYDGVACRQMTTPLAAAGRRVYGIAGTSSVNVYAVGEGGLILWFDGTAWQTMTSPTGATLRAVFALGWVASFNGGQQANEAYMWAVGDNGTIIRGQQAPQP